MTVWSHVRSPANFFSARDHDHRHLPWATATAKLGKVRVTINGIAKGAGMIAPDMATMLSFIFTDAAISAPALQALLKDGVADTFNAVTIDGDTSTSDTLMMFATGKASGAPRIARATDPRLKEFKKALHSVLASLSEQVARDGEGAQAGRNRGRRCGIQGLGAAYCHVDREFAAGKDRDRRRRCKLGPRCDGRRQSR
jgi:hypothetical protein